MAQVRSLHPLDKRLPTPTPTDARHNPTPDEFSVWCLHPVTRWVAKAYADAIDGHTAAWAKMLEQAAAPDELARAHLEYRTRADAYGAFLQTNHSDYLRRIDEREWSISYGQK